MNQEELAKLMKDMNATSVKTLADLLCALHGYKQKHQSGCEHGGECRRCAPCPPPPCDPCGPSLGDYLCDLSRMSLDYYRCLLELHCSYYERGSCHPRGKGKSADCPTEQIYVELHPGQTQVVTLMLENPGAEPADYVLLATAFAEVGKQESSIPVAVQFRPARPRVAPRARARVEAAITASDLLQPGRTYQGEVWAQGPRNHRFLLELKLGSAPGLATK